MTEGGRRARPARGDGRPQPPYLGRRSPGTSHHLPRLAYELFKRVRVEHGDKCGQSAPDDNADPEVPPEPVTPSESDDVELATAVRSAVLALIAAGFENLSKRLLTELGLTQLRTVGLTGDRGIDVEGHLRVNPVVSFRVGVQCKRYADGNQVTPRQVCELQGALGPFDRGILITTVFSRSRPRSRRGRLATSRSF